jgi:hypothetical protein
LWSGARPWVEVSTDELYGDQCDKSSHLFLPSFL